jgi:hypothetical protein
MLKRMLKRMPKSPLPCWHSGPAGPIQPRPFGLIIGTGIGLSTDSNTQPAKGLQRPRPGAQATWTVRAPLVRPIGRG